MTHGRPHPGMPTGWFQVGWSYELAAGDVRPLYYFGQHLALWRDEQGAPHLTSGYCPHLGTSLGHGGHVVGAALVCPMHGWQWDGAGRNVGIPYEDSVSPVCLPTWRLREADGFLWAWYATDGRAPTWEPPRLPEASESRYHAVDADTTRIWSAVDVHPQVIVETSADEPHNPVLHRASPDWRIERFSDDGVRFETVHRFTFGTRRSRMTPDGPVDSTLTQAYWGIGLGVNWFRGGVTSTFIQTQTPVDNDRIDIRGTVFVERADDSERPTGFAQKWIDMEWLQMDRHLEIWETMRYIANPPFTADEAAPQLALRKWAYQFYESPDRS